MIKLLISALISMSVLSCSPVNFTAVPDPNSVSLNGMWFNCQGDGQISQRIFIMIDGAMISEIIANYETSDCSGTPIEEYMFSGMITFEEVGQSTFQEQGTNITLKIQDVDLFTCGVGVEAYSYLVFNGNNGFYASAESPSCDPQGRGTGLGLYFTKIP